MNSIAIIGNAPYLNIKLGSYIDSFDEVVRFNRFIIDGHEEFIGKKTTIWCCNHFVYQEFKDTKKFSNFKNNNKIWHVLNNYWIIENKYGFKPSAGISAIYNALNLGYTNVFYYGIGKFGKNKTHHYFSEKKTKKHLYGPHNPKKEVEFINNLELKNKIYTIKPQLRKHIL